MPTAELQQWLQQCEWRPAFGERTWQRGRDYAMRGRVLELRASPDGQDFLLEGSVSGSGGRVYECRIRISRHGRTLQVEARCSCPVGIDCKHAAAMLLSMAGNNAAPAPAAAPSSAPPDWQAIAAARQAGAELSSWDHWLASLERMAGTAPPAEPERCFGILLRGGDHGDRLLALPAWLRPSKSRAGSRSWVDPQPLQSNELFGPVPAPPEG